MKPEPDEIFTTRLLCMEIEKLYAQFLTIRGEAESIVSDHKMPDATLHLNDVLLSTEEATTTILNSAASIDALISASALGDMEKQEVARHVGKVYEACTFQDISGQRIKKVLRSLNDLEHELARLCDITKGKTAALKKEEDSLLSGPQLSGEAPSQGDVDALFSQVK